MIAKLRGRIAETGSDWAVVDVGGVGYLVACTGRLAALLARAEGEVSLFIETELREDSLRLFAFETATERDWYRVLKGVQGVGPKLALSILGALPPETLAAAALRGDEKAFQRASGVGAKLAKRLATELKDKVPAGGAVPALAAPVPAAPRGIAGEAVSALVNLGYAEGEAERAVAAAGERLGPGAALASLIRDGLKELSR